MTWTFFLPMGKRFSLDVLIKGLREGNERTHSDLVQSVSKPRDTKAVFSLAVLGVLLQFSVIYFFNAIEKFGITWKEGSAVHYLLYQESIVTAFGLWVRNYIGFGVSKFFTYGTLGIELLLGFLILSPLGRPWTRRFAIVLIFLLHGSIALLANLGLFSLVMVVFGSLLLVSEDWDTLEKWGRSPHRRRIVFYDEDCGLCFQWMRLMVHLNWFGRIEPISNRQIERVPKNINPATLNETLLVCDLQGNRQWTKAKAIGQALMALPGGWFLGWIFWLPGIHKVANLSYDWLSRNRTRVSTFFNLPACGIGPSPSSQIKTKGLPSGTGRWLTYSKIGIGEIAVVLLFVITGSQVLTENTRVPDLFRHNQPRWIKAAVSYLRLNQGWSIFAPEAPLENRMIVVDGITVEGRHLDPLNEVASRVADPFSRSIPARLEQNYFWVNYLFRLTRNPLYFKPFNEWILHYHERTGRPEDQIVSFKSYVISHQSPKPGESAFTHQHVDLFMAYPPE